MLKNVEIWYKIGIFISVIYINIFNHERINNMKKIAYLVSAVAAGLGFSTAAQADVTVSGSGGLEVLSAGSTTTVYQGGSVTFALSTTNVSVSTNKSPVTATSAPNVAFPATSNVELAVTAPTNDESPVTLKSLPIVVS